MPEWPRHINREMRQHLDDEYAALRAGGATHEDAMRELATDLAEVSAPSPAADVIGDVRYAVRSLRAHPGFTAVILATLALGIGANAAIFSVVNAVLFRPLPYEGADRIVVVWGDLHRPGVNEIPASAGEYVDYRDRTHAFEHVAVYDTAGFNLTGAGEPEELDGAIVTASLFPLLGASAEIGRTFTSAEEQPGRNDVALLGHALWRRRFNRNPAIIGQVVSIDGRPTQVVGVMPATFQFPDPAVQVWKPLLLDAEALSADNRGSHGYTALARLRPGVTRAQAQADLAGVTATFKAQYPGNYRTGFSTTLRPLQDEIVGDTGRPLLILLGAVGLVLLIACANVSNLLLARAASRRREIALRTALGASRGRLVRQLLTESVLIALAGGALGLAIASWGVDLLIALAPDTIPRLAEVTLDRRVAVFTALVSFATGLIFGIVPALRASGPALSEALKDGGRSAESAMHGRAGRLLVVSEVALSLVLLAGAGLLVHSFARVQNVEPGFDARGLLTLRLALPESRYTTFEKGDRFFDALFAALRARPEVGAVGAVNALPFSGVGGSRTFHIEGREPKRPEDQPEEQLRIVTDGYFQTMRIPLLKGREFSDRDRLGGGRVALVNEALARKHWPDGSAIGRRVAFSRDEPQWYEIVGVVANVKHRGLDAADRPELYVPYRQPLFANWTVRPMQIAVRTAGDPLMAAGTVRREIARLDPDQPISDVRTMDERIGRSLAGRRFNMILLAVFAALALALAGIGIYGIVAYAVTQRTHEIGVRLALGAQRRDVVAMIVAQGMAMTAAGALVGVVSALLLTRLMSSLLFGVSAADPITFTAVPLLLAAVAFIACYVPARRATRVDPLVALRTE
jgi:putative ABC transport system permease protein